MRSSLRSENTEKGLRGLVDDFRAAAEGSKEAMRELKNAIAKQGSAAEKAAAELKSSTEKAAAELKSSTEKTAAELQSSTEKAAAELKSSTAYVLLELRVYQGILLVLAIFAFFSPQRAMAMLRAYNGPQPQHP